MAELQVIPYEIEFRLFGGLASMVAEQKEIELFEASNSTATVQAFSHGIKLSKVNQLFSGLDIVVLLGKLQQQGIVRITFDSVLDTEPFVQLTEKGKHLVIALLFSS